MVTSAQSKKIKKRNVTTKHKECEHLSERLKVLFDLERTDRLSNIAVNCRKLAKYSETNPKQKQLLLEISDKLKNEIISNLSLGSSDVRVSKGKDVWKGNKELFKNLITNGE